MRKAKMNTKNLMVSFVAIAMALILVATVSAGDITSGALVTVEGIPAIANNISVTAGETITVKVYFTAVENDTDVVVTAEIEGDKVDTEAQTSVFDVENGSVYRKTLNIKVPYELKDKQSDTVELNIEIEGRDHDKEIGPIMLRVQRPSYNVGFKSINVAGNAEAGKSFPVDVVLKNTGYNELEDLYVTAKISDLGIEESFYFGDLVAIDNDHDDDTTDTLSKRFYLSVPYDVEAGEYALEVEVRNDDAVLSKNVMVAISNEFPERAIKSGNDLVLVNPTGSVTGYRIVAESPASISENLVFVPAGSTETITVTPNAEGEYSFDVNVFSMSGELVSTVTYSGSEETSQIANPIVILTVILAIIFVVLLVVLIVLITKKPEKA
ncbi:MAG: hypothetical protein P8X70_02085, partial [Nanoarchaeota archaeon]